MGWRQGWGEREAKREIEGVRNGGGGARVKGTKEQQWVREQADTGAAGLSTAILNQVILEVTILSRQNQGGCTALHAWERRHINMQNMNESKLCFVQLDQSTEQNNLYPDSSCGLCPGSSVKRPSA